MESTLLIADNDPELAELFQRYFVRHAYRTLTASGGVECLPIIRNESPAVIVASMDLMWGGADGLVDYLREESLYRRIPSVILTGATPAENVAALREEPCVFCYLHKPFPMGMLLDCIRTIESDPSSSERSPLRTRSREVAAISSDAVRPR